MIILDRPTKNRPIAVWLKTPEQNYLAMWIYTRADNCCLLQINNFSEAWHGYEDLTAEVELEPNLTYWWAHMHEIELLNDNTTNTITSTINHPKHYGGEGNIYETINVIEAWDLGFALGNALKYISRAGKKNPSKKLEDLQKAKWYLEREIQNTLLAERN